jgi:glycerol-3-phosphate dehydrogenase
VIGGGVNGAGIARDAAGRGLAVLLVEKNDLAGATSSASSKLIHGGLRYLEQYEFRLVAEALAEREVLLRIARHLVWPARFVMPHVPELRPRWMIRRGLFLYDHLTRRAVARRLDCCATRSPAAQFGSQAGLQAWFRIFGLPGRRCAAGNRQRDERARSGRPGALAHRLSERAP